MNKRKKINLQFTVGSTPIITTIGKRVRDARDEAGLSQEKLAQEIGLSRISLSKIETGRRKQVRPDTIRKIAKIVGKSEGYFYRVDDNLPRHEVPVGATDTEAILTLINRIGLTTSIQDILVKLSAFSHPQQEKLGNLITQLLAWYESQVTGTENAKQASDYRDNL